MRMHSWHRAICSLSMAAALSSAVLVTGCAERRGYRVYDPDYNDYHTWNNHERTYYRQWEAETHRRDEDYQKRNRDEQNEYWNWRHHHPDNNRDREQQ
jgi:hypothetical protein